MRGVYLPVMCYTCIYTVAKRLSLRALDMLALYDSYHNGRCRISDARAGLYHDGVITSQYVRSTHCCQILIFGHPPEDKLPLILYYMVTQNINVCHTDKLQF